jgi:hypothetical protein
MPVPALVTRNAEERQDAMFKTFKFVIVWIIVAAVTSVTIAYASSDTNSIPDQGEGASQINGWTVTNIEYHLANDASKLAAVEFDLDRPAGTVMVKVIAADAQYFSCVNNVGNHWRCEPNTDISIASMDELRVIATGN